MSASVGPGKIGSADSAGAMAATAMRCRPNLWDLFTGEHEANCRTWTHHPGNPVLPAAGNSWKSRWTANPDFLQLDSRTLLYYRGNGTLPGESKDYHDRIGVAEVRAMAPGRFEFRDLNNGSPVVDIGMLGEFDDRDVLDPASVVFNGQVLLYYSAVGAGPDSIGLAVSNDGEHFTKCGKIMEARAPEVVLRDGRLFLLTQRLDEGHGYRLYLASSEDGRAFSPVTEQPVFAGQPDQWDAKSVITCRILRQGDWYIMVYGGSSDFVDEPEYFGLARSRDLVTWERHPGNPVFGAGARGTADGGAIWYPAIAQSGGSTVMLYEGSPGRYKWGLCSGICMAWIT